jgi:FAD-linked oxidoreductase
MNRRHLIKSLIATTISGTIASTASLSSNSFASNTTSSKKYPWKNWSGNQQCMPSERIAPANIEELQSLIKHSQGRIRAVGAGHSFSELVPTDETLLSIRRLAGLKNVDATKNTATIYAGTTLREIGPLLNAQNQALVNMPDIDQQTLSGCICTSTHGTGRQLGSLSHYVEALDIVTASGDLLHCSQHENADLFKAAQVSLGALGIITSITMKNTAPFKLKRQSQWLPFEDLLPQAEALSHANRNFEFYYFPFTGMALTDALNITTEASTQSEELDGNSGIMDLKSARDYLSWSNKLRELILSSYMKTIALEESVDHSYAIYATERNVRFNEMEYHLPAELGLKALQEVRIAVESKFPEVFFPIECRFIKGDDIWLSPFYQRDTISIAVHRYFEENHAPLYKVVEPILQKYQGRPHWGKINTFSTKQFAHAYPQWQAFQDVRQHYDPQGKFLNPYLMRTFGLR